MFSLMKKLIVKSNTEKPKQVVFQFPNYDLSEEAFNAFISRAKNVTQTNYIIAIIVEYLNYKEALGSISGKLSDNQNNSDMIYIYSQLENAIEFASVKTFFRKVNIEDKQYYESCGYRFKESESIRLSVNELPILLNPWNGNRVLGNFCNINDENVFSGVEYSNNIENEYHYPMNIIICSGGNHSQLAARYKHSGETIVKHSIDYSILYNYIYFDGNVYRYKENESEVYIDCNRELLFYSGVIFELGRIILENSYYDKHFPKELISI